MCQLISLSLSLKPFDFKGQMFFGRKNISAWKFFPWSSGKLLPFFLSGRCLLKSPLSERLSLTILYTVQNSIPSHTHCCHFLSLFTLLYFFSIAPVTASCVCLCCVCACIHTLFFLYLSTRIWTLRAGIFVVSCLTALSRTVPERIKMFYLKSKKLLKIKNWKPKETGKGHEQSTKTF